MTNIFLPEADGAQTTQDTDLQGAQQRRRWLISLGRIATMLSIVGCAFGYLLAVRSNHRLDDDTRHAAAANFGDFGSWRRVQEFSGAGETDLAEFSIRRSPWSIAYIAQPRGDDPMRFQVLVYNNRGGFVEVAADLDHASRGMARVTGTGDYRLRVNGTAFWKINVEEYR